VSINKIVLFLGSNVDNGDTTGNGKNAQYIHLLATGIIQSLSLVEVILGQYDLFLPACCCE